MSDHRKRRGALRATVGELLRSEDFEKQLPAWTQFPSRQIINPLLSFLYVTDEVVKWRAVKAVGIVVAHMADEEMETARVIMRRLIWSLNDESGGIGWGAPEAMGEIMAVHEGLAEEYFRILLSYVQEDGNPLENGLLERGVLWGLGRIAQARPHLLRSSASSLLPYLSSEDPVHRGLAAWTLALLEFTLPSEFLQPLFEDPTRIVVCENGELRPYRICDLAKPLAERSSDNTGNS